MNEEIHILANSTVSGTKNKRVIYSELNLNMLEQNNSITISWEKVPGLIGFSRKSIEDALVNFFDTVFDYHDGLKNNSHKSEYPAIMRIQREVENLFIPQ